jgi:hypothetical protein
MKRKVYCIRKEKSLIHTVERKQHEDCMRREGYCMYCTVKEEYCLSQYRTLCTESTLHEDCMRREEYCISKEEYCLSQQTY